MHIAKRLIREQALNTNRGTEFRIAGDNVLRHRHAVLEDFSALIRSNSSVAESAASLRRGLPPPGDKAQASA